MNVLPERTSAWILRLALTALVIGAAGCGGTSGDRASGRLRVVTTVSPITNIVQNVGGDRVELTGIVPEGTNSHTFEPAPSDARLLAEGDVVFMNGLHLEEPARRLAESSVRKGVEVVRLGERTISPSEYIFDFSFPKEAGDPNPHLWTNPPYAKRYAEIVRDVLTELRPDDAPTFRGNAEVLIRQIDALDAAARTVTATVPPGNRKLLTYHDSFPYFARAYGWTIIGAVQPSDFSDPTPREIAELVEQIRRERIPAIFGSDVFPSPVLAQIARESGARYVDDLRDDDLPGKAGDRNHSFVGLMVHNFRTFMKALGGNIAPFETFDARNVVDDSSSTYRE